MDKPAARGSGSKRMGNWSDPTTVFTLAPGETGGPESPTLLALHGGFYLIWCRWDAKLSGAGVAYQDRSYVYYSDTPLNFNERAPVAEIPGHAPEVFQAEDGDWWISSAERPFRGVSIAPFVWEQQPTSNAGEAPQPNFISHRGAEGTEVFNPSANSAPL